MHRSAAFLFQKKIVLGLIADKKQDFLRQQGIGLCRAFQPGTVFATPVQVVLEHLPIQHKGDGCVAVLHPQLQVSQPRRFLSGRNATERVPFVSMIA